MACISGFTLGGYYSYVDCCGLVQAGVSPGLENVCVSASTSGTSIGVLLDSGSTCTQNCNQGPLSYVFTVTGVCGNPSGTVTIQSFGGIPPYTIDNITTGLALICAYVLSPRIRWCVDVPPHPLQMNSPMAALNLIIPTIIKHRRLAPAPI